MHNKSHSIHGLPPDMGIEHDKGSTFPHISGILLDFIRSAPRDLLATCAGMNDDDLATHAPECMNILGGPSRPYLTALVNGRIDQASPGPVRDRLRAALAKIEGPQR